MRSRKRSVAHFFRMDIKRYITREDFLRICPFKDGGTLIDGRRYAACFPGKLSHINQLKHLGEPDKTGEGVMDKVFFFEVVKDPRDEVAYLREDGEGVVFHLISAKIVERYKVPSAQEGQKEMALIAAKIKLNDKRKKEKK